MIVFGPWLGEFGWELMYWQGYVRNQLEKRNLDKGEYCIMSYAGNQGLYPIDSTFVPLPRDMAETVGSYPNMYFLKYYHSNRRVRDLYDICRTKIKGNDLEFVDPISAHESGILEFGKPQHNQSFIKLKPRDNYHLLREDRDKPRIMVFPRFRNQNTDKNKSLDWWAEVFRNLSEFRFIIGGLEGPSFADLSGVEYDSRSAKVNYDGIMVDPKFPSINGRLSWVEFQLSLMTTCEFCLCCESGTIFLALLAGKRTIAFGSRREIDRIDRENVLKTPLIYIPEREITPSDLINQIKGGYDEFI